MKFAKQRNFCNKRAAWNALLRTPWTLFPYTFVPLVFKRGPMAPGDIPEKELA